MSRSTAARGAQQAKSWARDVRANRWFHLGARLGLAMVGLVNGIVGVIAIVIAFRGGQGAQADQAGAFEELASTPGGVVLLWVIAAGMAMLAVWLVFDAIAAADPEPKDRWMSRAKAIGKAVVYGVLASVAVTVVLQGGSGGGSTEEGVTAQLLGLPAGPLLVGAVGLGIVVGGAVTAWRGISHKFREDIAPPGGTIGRTVDVLGTTGYVARGFAFGAIGVLFVVAAVLHDPDRSGGLDDALSALRQLPLGPVLIAAIGLGFLAFGAYCGFWARYAKL